MVSLAAAFVIFWVACVGYSVFAGSDSPGRKRRSHFRARIAVAGLVPPLWMALLVGLWLTGSSQASDEHALVAFTFMGWVPCAAFIPAVLYKWPHPSSGPADDEGGGGGGGSDPDAPSAPRVSPRGGIPLPDAEQSRARARDHTRRGREPVPRRATPEPGRAPKPSHPGGPHHR